MLTDKNDHLNRCRKALDKIRPSSVLKTHSKLRKEVSQSDKEHLENLTANSMLNGTILNAFSLK